MADKEFGKLIIKDSEGNAQTFIPKGSGGSGSADIDYEYTEETETLRLFSKPSGIELTEEHLTGELYNGKPVYEKLFKGHTSTTGTTISMEHNISDIDKVFLKQAYIYTGNNECGSMFNMQYISNPLVDKTQFKFTRSSTSYYSNNDYYFLLAYTKTTD